MNISIKLLQLNKIHLSFIGLMVLLFYCMHIPQSVADGIKFHEIATDPDSGLSYERDPSPELIEILNAFNAQGVITLPDDLVKAPAKSEGTPGIAVLDYGGDGDQDLHVQGRAEPNRLFENQENGTFIDITKSANIAAGNYTAQICAMGDINGDGLPDISIGNTFDMRSNTALIVEPFALSEPDQLFLNTGNNTFEDINQAI